MARVAVAMSGGVDSSVAAMLLADQGHDVLGLTFDSGQPGAPAAAADAARVAAAIGIEHRVVDLSAEFETKVIEYFRHEYASGRTPNPCLACNRQIKFGLLLDEALRAGAARLATGHYARIGTWEPTGRLHVRRAVDNGKDQSYALYALSQQQLSHALFPLGELYKEDVRRGAAGAGLPVSAKPESQDLCFVSGGDYRSFLRARWPEGFEPGPLLETSGRQIGRHDGIANFTVGQRKGLGLGAGEPLYVLQIIADQRAVVVGPRRLAAVRGLAVGDCSWMALSAPEGDLRVTVKLRYGQAPAAATLRARAAGEAVEVWLDLAQTAVTPGQAAVCYSGDAVLGGGIIGRTLAQAAPDGSS